MGRFLKNHFWSNKTEYVIGFFALLMWGIFEMGGIYFGWATYPVGYFQKIFFGIFGMTIISTVTWFWMSNTQPKLKMLIDPDSVNLETLNQWERVKLALAFFLFYGLGTVFLASLY